MERRFLNTATSPITLEARADGKPPVLIGYGAVFHNPADPGTEYKLGRGLKERIMPTAFDRALFQEKQDVRGLFNHDANLVLGRSSAGTMLLTKDAKGLRYEITPPGTQVGRDVVELVKRGDVTGSSFSFRTGRQAFIEADDGMDVRELHDVDLFDVGPVCFPAYTSATAGMRSDSDDSDVCEDARSAWDDWRSKRERAAVTFEAGPTFDGDGWDATQAEARIRAWANEGDRQNWGKYKRAFAWFDQKDPNAFGAYKLLHHDVRDGKLVVHRKGVIAAMGALLDGRAQVPEEEREAVYRHLARHFEQFKMEPPEFKSLWVPSRELLAMRQKLAEAEAG